MNLLQKSLIVFPLLTISLYAKVSKYEFELIENILPKTKIDTIKKTAIDGLYLVNLKNKSFLYIYPYKELIVFGEIYTKNGKSLTQYSRQTYLSNITHNNQFKEFKVKSKKNKEYFTKILNNALYIKNLNEKKLNIKFVVYKSPVCGHCINLENYFKEKNITSYQYYVPHPRSYKILKSKYKIKDPKNKIKQQMKIIEKLNLEGTPNILVLDNENNLIEMIAGADLNRIDNLVKKHEI